MRKKTVQMIISNSLMIGLWASAFPGIRAGLEGYTPEHLALFRLLIGSMALLLFAVLTKMRLPDIKDIPAIFLLGFLGFALYHILLNIGEKTVSAGVASLLVTTAPIFSAMLSRLFFRGNFGFAKWIGSMISLLGVSLIAFGAGDYTYSMKGILFILLAAFSESIYFVFQPHYIKKYGFIRFVTFSIWGGTIPMLVFLPGLGEEMINASMNSTLSIVYLGLLPTVVPYFALAYVTSLVGTSEATLSLYATPALALLMSWLWIGEIPAFISLLGGVVTVGGVCFTYLKSNNMELVWKRS
ncbi:DMT family transporter [Bacillus spizizenii ATCC 6633 = JCM 2499]|uniref:Putative permease n=1 Tax=Bacillus spizizenii (strain ATCC 23059 / NRRL B-14472 / W23) TaxID=655816 RepID=E0U4D1_BACSH|nr:EamA family transporter [Bacillus spizizenii]QCJ15895.1 EamA family transporter [Bacillus subtilis]ADM36589.1 putative permease [Bacillus spizizenii str. W23]AJW86023.1 membrane protein [Bacillus spizizenii]EFG91049.1 putative permease [Bacillus spizizenii ATCC 6633 = JCM 2499]KFK78977.1 eamA-like transporter family protein [Bacillus spizizenii]